MKLPLSAIVVLCQLVLSVSAQAHPHGVTGLPPTFFNGGRAQLNFNFLSFGGGYPFLNLMKTGPIWFNASTNLAIPPNLLDANGYAASGVGSPNMYQNIIVPPPAERPGNYVVAWDGNGTILASTGVAVSYNATGAVGSLPCKITIGAHNLAVGQTVALGSFSGITGLTGNQVITAVDATSITVNVATTGAYSSGGTVTNTTTNPSTTSGGRYVFSGVSGPSNGQYSINVGISTNGTVPITNLRLLYDADEAAYNSGQTWQPVFLHALRNAKVGVLRFMDWEGNQGANYSNMSTWQTRKSKSYVCYACPQMDPARWVSSMTTAANGQDHAGTLVGITPIDRDTIHIQPPGAAISSITQTGGVATVTTVSPHGLASGATTYNVHIAGSTNGYNTSSGSQTLLTVTGASTFTYPVSSGLPSPSTGTATFTVLNTSAVTLNSTVGADLLLTCASACGVNNGDPVQLVGTSGGAKIPVAQSGGNLSIGSTLCVTGAATNTFNVAFTCGGANIKIGTAGSGTFSFTRMPTLAMNGGSAIGICGPAGSALDWAHDIRTVAISTPMYDATFGCWIKGGAAVNNSSQGLDNGVPFDVMLDLAAQVGAHPYFVTPPYSAEPPTPSSTDFNTQLATFLKGSAPTWMIPRIEPPNEVWNAMFIATSFAEARGELYGYGFFAQNDWYGLAASYIGQSWASVYGIGNIKTKYHVLAAIQSVSAANGGVTANAPRLESTKFVAGSPTPPSGYAALAACKYVSAVAMAQYQTPGAYRTTQSVIWAFNYFLSGNTDLTQLANYNDTTVNQTNGNILGTMADIYQWALSAKGWQQNYGSSGASCGGSTGAVNDLMGYEGGLSFTAPVNTPTAVVQSTTNINTDVISTVAGNPTQVTLGTTNVPYTGSSVMPNGCTFTGKIDNGSGGAGNTLTVTNASSCPSPPNPNPNGILVGDVISGGTVASGTKITANGTGLGAAGTYTVNGAAQLVASASLTARFSPPVVVNMYVCFSGLTGSWATFNFATSNTCYKITTVNDAINGVVTLALDSSAATGSSTGSIYYSGDALGGLVANTTGGALYAAYLNSSIGVKSHPDMNGYTSGGSYAGGLNGNLDNFVKAGGVNPSQFEDSGAQTIWAPLDPDYFLLNTTVPPIWQGLTHFNTNWLLKRDFDPVANDNSPMWLEKTA